MYSHPFHVWCEIWPQRSQYALDLDVYFCCRVCWWCTRSWCTASWRRCWTSCRPCPAPPASPRSTSSSQSGSPGSTSSTAPTRTRSENTKGKLSYGPEAHENSAMIHITTTTMWSLITRSGPVLFLLDPESRICDRVTDHHIAVYNIISITSIFHQCL